MKLILFFTLLITSVYSNTLKIIPPQSTYDSSHAYFNSLLNNILDVTSKKYGQTYISYSNKLEQGRALIQLKYNKDIDIYWAGTSIKREEALSAIKIPLLKGLLGYRAFIINKDNLKKFQNIKSLDDLKQLKACQGKHWPDTDILIDNGFKVIKNANYEAMFAQVQNNRCDYFPRGIHEIYSEMSVRKEKYNKLMIYDKFLIYYPFPMYFFVSKENIKLKTRIQKGLNILINNEKFLKHMKSNIITKHLFPIENWQNKKIFKLKNNLLSKNTNFNDNRLWITPPK